MKALSKSFLPKVLVIGGWWVHLHPVIWVMNGYASAIPKGLFNGSSCSIADIQEKNGMCCI